MQYPVPARGLQPHPEQKINLAFQAGFFFVLNMPLPAQVRS
uniref:Uncharacterized protein n=1 Tax=Klebsiella pneumoniae TaxID=573 RepID=A0A3G4RJB5_KLEPN|nr:hypothetical protein [Klebsiella pneumoniae]QIM13778.1 hypothetical protein [Klebsiella pneumoniae]